MKVRQQVWAYICTKLRVYNSKTFTSEVHKGSGVKLLTTRTMMGAWMTSQAQLRKAVNSCTWARNSK